MKTQRGIWLMGALLLGASGALRAQETLGGVAAAGAAGAALGAGGAGALSAGQATRGLPPAPGGATNPNGSQVPGGAPGSSGASGSSSTTTTVTKTVIHPPVAEIYSGTGADFVNELLSVPARPVREPVRVRRSPRAQARYAARMARMSKRQRTRRVMAKYHIAPIGWEAAYLPQDRYKFGKIWNFVSTEDDHFYYTPSGMALKRFNPNRVIGFNSYSDALLAGYRPDPRTRPAPGGQIAYLAHLYRGPELDDFVGYVYAGQIDAQTLSAVVSYSSTIERTLRPTRARPYIGSTVAKVLEAALTGDTSDIPTRFDQNGPIVSVTTTTTTTTINGVPQFPSAGGGAPRGNLMPPSSGMTPSSTGMMQPR